MWRYETLGLLYVTAWLAVWTWTIRNQRVRARRRNRASALRRRQRLVEGLGAACIALVALAAALLGFVGMREIALVLGALVGGTQVLMVLTFHEQCVSARSSA